MVHGLQPILSRTLWFVTKQFKAPFNIQFIGIENNQSIFSDGVSSIVAGMGDYTSMFSSITANTIISCVNY